MKVNEAMIMLASELEKHGLRADGWTLRSSRRMTSNRGVTSFNRKEIVLSEPFILANDKERVYMTVIHEIAHALVGVGHHHDKVWQQKAKELGHPGTRFLAAKPYGPSNSSKYKTYYGKCPEGHTFVIRRARHPNKRSSCSYCSNKWNPDYIISWSV